MSKTKLDDEKSLQSAGIVVGENEHYFFCLITDAMIMLLLKPMDSFGMWWKSNEIIFLHWIINL